MPSREDLQLLQLRRALATVDDLDSRSSAAFDHGFYAEVIGLRTQSVDLFLRLYLGAKYRIESPYSDEKRLTLGDLIAAAGKRGLSESVVESLKAYNAARLRALHEYLLGGGSYGALKEVCEQSVGLIHLVVDAIAVDLSSVS